MGSQKNNGEREMITLFEEVTTEKALTAIEKDASLYDGMFVDMKIDKERKFVKDKAKVIGSLLKKLDRARIDKSAEFKTQVETEAAKIKTRLEDANKPFTELMDQYKEVRRVELEQEKALQAAKDLAFQLPLDHEEAISINELFDFKIAERARKEKERDDLLIKEANDRAAKAESDKKQAKRQAKIDAENAEKQRLIDVKRAKEEATRREIERQERERRGAAEAQEKLETNKKHIRKICGQAKDSLMKNKSINEKLANEIVKMIAKGEINNVAIHY